MKHPLQILAGALGILLPTAVYAYQLPAGWSGIMCGFIPCTGVPYNGAVGLSAYIDVKIITALEIGFVAALLIVLFLSAIYMVFFASEESAVKEGRSAFYYAITGSVIIASADLIRKAFDPLSIRTDSRVGLPTGGGDPITGDSVIANQAPIDTAITQIILYFKLLLSIALIVNIVLQSFRLISSQGEQGDVEKARKRLIAGFIGVGVVLLSWPFIDAVRPSHTSSLGAATEIRGVANFLLTIFGAIAVVAMIVAGILLVISVDEGLKEKSKTIIKVTVFALVIILASFALVNTFITI